jgi:hypothetical protein
MSTYHLPCHTVIPEQGPGWHPALIETATGRTMASISGDDRKTRVEPAFYDCWEAQLFRLCSIDHHIMAMLKQWPLVQECAREMHIEFNDPVVSG